MLSGMIGQVNETMELLVSQKGCWRNITMTLTIPESASLGGWSANKK
jgi:hypothetical protein